MCKRKLPRPAPPLTARPPAPPAPPPIRGTALQPDIMGLLNESAALRAENAALRAEIARLRAENGALRAAVERVLALHEIFGDWCDRCNCVAPCATLSALEGTP